MMAPVVVLGCRKMALAMVVHADANAARNAE